MVNSNFLIPSVIQLQHGHMDLRPPNLTIKLRALFLLKHFYFYDNNNVAYHFNLRKSLLKLIKLHNFENILLVFFSDPPQT